MTKTRAECTCPIEPRGATLYGHLPRCPKGQELARKYSQVKRPDRGKVLLQVAQVIAQRGTCDRKQVGAVIAREGRIISVGYNGAPPGLPHCDENCHGYGFDNQEVHLALSGGFDLIAERGCRNATHAEANALAFAAKYGVSTDEAELYVTVSPCETCARLLIAAGILGVHYIECYRDDSGLELLRQALVPTYEWLEG